MVGAGLPWTGPASRRPSGTVSASLPLSPCLLLQVVLNQKFTDCFVLVFLDSHLGKTVRMGVRAVPHVLHPSLLGWRSLLPGPSLPSSHHHPPPPAPPCSPQSLTVVFREPFPVQPQDSESPPAQLVSTYHHLESVINTACFTLWTRLL